MTPAVALLVAFTVVSGLSRTSVASGLSRTVQSAPAETIAEIRVHGNATLSDDAVIKLGGVSIGMPLDAGGVDAIQKRLRDSGRFDEVEVRKRYRTLAMDDVALLLVVHEKPGITPAGTPPTLFRRLRGKLMYFPIVHYDDGYGWTYGGRASLVGAFGAGERVSVPLSWGATKRAALEVDRTFKSGPLSRLSGSFDVAQRENPHFNLDDRRTEIQARAERRLFDTVTIGGELARTSVRFAPARDTFWTSGADATLDTRRDPSYPVDAVVAGVTWNRMYPIGTTTFGGPGATIDRYRFDARGFKRVFGQIVFAAHAEYDTASAALPEYEQWLVGGSNLRGTRAGTFAGDKRLLWGGELRVPFTSPLGTGRLGFNVFLDGGASAPFGQRIGDAPTRRGAGAGFFILAPLVNLNFDVAHSLDGRGTRFHFGTGFTF